MGDIVTPDFGKSAREAARKYARLVGILDAQAEAFIRDPEAFFQDAGDRFERLATVINSAKDALRPQVKVTRDDDPVAMDRMHTISVPRDEWERLRKCADIVRDFQL